METNIKEQIKKELWKVGGHNLAFKKVKEYIDASPDPKLCMMLIALTLGDREVRDIPVWNRLCERFFKYFRTNIIRYYRYECDPPTNERILVVDTEHFIENMARLKRADVFDECSYQRLGHILDLVFNTGYIADTLTNKLKEAVTD